MASDSCKSVLDVQTSTTPKDNRSAHTEARFTTTPLLIEGVLQHCTDMDFGLQSPTPDTLGRTDADGPEQLHCITFDVPEDPRPPGCPVGGVLTN
ncbi:hypothetical protein GCM10010402_28460 [Actinomadura luteofluorescens]